jgi:hypothetical protein
MREAEELARRCDPTDATGVIATICSARLILAGDVLTAIDVRERYIARPDAVLEAADYCAALTLYVLCSNGRRDLITPGCLDRALAIAERTEVPVVRLVSWIALAWALAETDPSGSATFTKAALDAHEPLPVYHRRLTASFLGRFLIGQAPSVAAGVLTRYLEAGDSADTRTARRIPTDRAGLGADLADGVALATAIALLGRCGHPLADDGVATLAHGPSRSYLAVLVPARPAAPSSSTGTWSRACRPRSWCSAGDSPFTRDAGCHGGRHRGVNEA